MAPRLNPDGAELALADRPRHIRSSTRPYPYDEEPVDGLTVEDVDGDGRVLSMRIPDPHGAYKKHAAEPRLMVPREPGEFGGEYYRVMPEGTLKNFDGLTITANPDREGLDLNRNFPAYWRQEFEQVGAGPYPTSEPEVRAMVDFVIPPPQHRRRDQLPHPQRRDPAAHGHAERRRHDARGPVDVQAAVSDLGAKLTGYPAISIFHDFKYHPKETITGTQDWVYEHLGALFWTVEIWAPNKEAGITDYKWIDWYRDHPVEDDLKLLKWSDEQCGGQAHVDWQPVPPPAARRGGARRLGQDELLAQPAAAPARARGGALPGLDDADRAVAAAGSSCCAPRCAPWAPTPGACASRCANSGYLPAYVSKRALERKTARGVVFEIHLPRRRQPGQRQGAHRGPAARRATRRRPRCRPSCPTARSPPTARSSSGW